MIVETIMLLALSNLVLCTLVGWACVVRFSAMNANNTAFAWRLRYAVLFGAATASGFSPLLFGEWPGYGQVIAWAAILFVIGFGDAWANRGVPEYAKPPERTVA